MKIREALKILVEKQRIKPREGSVVWVAGSHPCGRKIAPTPDYWEYGV